MPYQGFENGLYIARQKSQNKPGISHYGIIDIGNRIRYPNADGVNPIVIHQTPPQLRIDWLRGTGKWELLGRITDEKMACARIQEAAKNPAYDLFGNNCEHFARFIATGKKESKQIQTVATIGLVALAAYSLR